MSGWPLTTLEQLCAEGGGFIKTGPFGSQLHRSDYIDDPVGIPVVMPKNMVDGRIDLADIARIGADTADRLSQHLLTENDVVLSRRGDVGRSAWIEERDLPAFCGTGSMRVHLGSPVSAHPEYLRYFFRSKLSSDYLEAHAVGATMPNLNTTIVGSLPVPVPPLEVQISVSRALSPFDDLIENNRRRIELLESMARAIYREWFVHFRFPGHEDVPMVDSDLGPIPDGWRSSRLSELVSTQYGYTESADDKPVGPHYLRGMDINKRSWIDWSTVPYCPIDDVSLKKFCIDVGDIFVIRMADPGKVGICEEPVEAVFASYLVRLRPKTDRLLQYFLFYTLTSDSYQDWVTGASTGSTRKSVSAKVMVEPAIALPPAALQRAFVHTIKPMRGEMTSLVRVNAKLGAIRDLLLPKLVSGEIDVSELDMSS